MTVHYFIKQNDMDFQEKIESIAPYTEEETMAAIKKLAAHPQNFFISKYLFPDEPADYMRKMMRRIKSSDEFQRVVMHEVVEWFINNTTLGFTYDGVDKIRDFNGRFLAMSNHRDIVLDPALTQYMLLMNDIPLTEIAVGDNLLSSKPVEYLLRSNRMIKVIRGISARELYLSSQVLSKYIRETITSGKSSVWIAQRQGRTKNGIDTTEQGLLKMFDMSGTSTFVENFKELNILPLSISYEYEPCDVRKAREVLISRTRKYVKRRNEDMHSILMGMRQQKGHVHLHVGSFLTEGEIEAAAGCANKNDRYQWIRNVVDRRIIQGYKLWPTNYMAYDMLNKTTKYNDHYDQVDVEHFNAYLEHRMGKVEKALDRNDLREILLGIYAGPVQNKEKLFRDFE